jgi:hypothetical protein
MALSVLLARVKQSFSLLKRQIEGMKKRQNFVKFCRRSKRVGVAGFEWRSHRADTTQKKA